jgi:light-regulated signal transduction histidine kinase (bacteriophytochrome)
MNLLIIDDTQSDHDITVEFLEEAGGDYNFFHAFSATEGIEIYSKNHIDCVLLDYNMPDKDGLETLQQLSNFNRSVPIIMITGEGNEFVAVTAMKLGSQDYIPKRILTPSALKRAVERAVEHAEIFRKMEKYRLDLERSNHDLEQFANIVAHDLKSPLRAVTQHLTLIKNKSSSALDEKSLQSLSFAVEGAERMRLLIDALFDYARLGFSEPDFEQVDLEVLLRHAKRDLNPMIEEKNAKLTNSPLPTLTGDPVLLLQLLENLIANAIKYCKDTPRIHIDAQQEEGCWRINVRDNGIGIPPNQHKQIFGIFRRLHQSDEYPGIGLGLAICSRIAKQHGGIINVESEAGKGSCFYFTIPVAAAKPAVVEERKVANG